VRTQTGFWSGETLLKELPGLIEPFSPENVDCAAYTLAIGNEIYVSPTVETEDPRSKTIYRLSDGEAFTIPPGQFAFLLTEEIVEVPSCALAFISIKAKIKFRGLVNVSGFHVDPGFKGRLVFSVFNAGPATIHLKQGQPCFLIWYASLDCGSEMVKTASIQDGIDPQLINNISGELQSFESLLKKIKDVEKALDERVHKIERDHAVIRWGLGLLLTFIVGMVTWWIRGYISSPTTTAVPSSGIIAPASPAPPVSGVPAKTPTKP
jgi:dCTP deaminase